jgi:HlyD family secretion protein
LLKIVPDGCPTEVKDAAKGCLVAEVDVTNQDIGFVQPSDKRPIFALIPFPTVNTAILREK